MDSASKTGAPRVLAIDGDTYTLLPVKTPVQGNYDPIPSVPEEPENIPKESTFAFLRSTRFWAMILGSLSLYLEAKGLIGDEEMTFIATITSIFVAIKTYDKTVEKFTK